MIVHFLAILLLALCPPVQSIQYTTFGPNFTYQSGIDRLIRSFNQSMYNNGTIDQSIPVIRIGASWAEVSEFSEFSGLEGFLAFLIDFINFRGGIIVNASDPIINPSINQPVKNGTRYYLSLSFARNDASNNYMKLIYSDLASQSINANLSALYSTIPPRLIDSPMPIVLAPPYDQLTTLAPLIQNFSQTFLAVSNPDPNSFPRSTSNLTGNLLSMLVTGDLTIGPALTLINQKAQLLANEALTNITDDSQLIDSSSQSINGFNKFGISTACLFAANDSLSQIYIQSIRTWVSRENVKRRGLNATDDQLIDILIDSPWHPSLVNSTDHEIVYSDYVNSLSLCDDVIDLLVAIPTSASGTLITQALKESRIKPKSAIGLGYNVLRTNSDAMTSSNGWVIVNPVNLSTVTYPGSCFKSAINGLTGFYNYAPGVPGLQTSASKVSVILYMGALDMICGALSVTNGFSPALMRKAFSRMNGQMAMFSAVQFSNLTGINRIAPTNAINQVINSTSKAIPSNSPQNLVYPYDWPWSKTVTGDLLISRQGTTNVLVAIIICVLGAWVSLIVVEQAIFVRRKGGEYRPWLFITAVALGGVALWCGFFQQASGLVLTKPDDGSTLDLQYSINIAFLAFLPALTLTYLGLQIVILEIEDTTLNKGSEAARAKAEIRLEREEKRKKAALDNKAHLIHLYQSMNWKTFVGGLCIVAAVMCTRITMMYVWRTPADHTTVVWAWCVTVVMKLILIPLSVHLFFFAIRYRPVAAFLFAAGCVGDWQIHVNSVEFSYQPNRSYEETLYSALVDPENVTIITGTLAAVTCFVFIGLQFSRMQLSRNGLSVLVASLESVIHQQRKALKDDSVMFSKMKTYIDHQCRMIESINLLTPFSNETLFILASQSSMSSFVRNNTPSHNRRPSTMAKMTRVMHDRDIETSVNQSVNQSTNHHISSRNSPQVTSIVTPISQSINHLTTSNNEFILGQSAHSPDSTKKSKQSIDQSINQPINQYLELKNRSGSSTTSVIPSRRKSINQIVPIDSTDQSINQSLTQPINQPEESPKSNQTTMTMSDVENSQFLFTRTSINASINQSINHSLKPSSHSKPGEMSPQSDEGNQSINQSNNPKTSPVHQITEPLTRGSMFSSSQSITHSINQSINSSPVHQVSKLGQRGTRTSQSINQSINQTSNKSLKVYEEDCIQLIEQMIAYKRDNFAPKINQSINQSLNRSSLIGEIEDDTSYSSKLPLISHSHHSINQSLHPNQSINQSNNQSICLPVSACTPSLTILLNHPVCVEIIKQELHSIHSSENLSFWLSATRYRRCVSSRLRKLIALSLYETFIKEGSNQQININTRQRESISQLIHSKKQDDSYTSEMFREIEHEVVLLMETNMMKTFNQSAKYRLCAWICYVMPHSNDSELATEFEKAGTTRAGKDSLLISSTNESNQSVNQSISQSNRDRTAYVTRTRASLTHNEIDQSINDVKRLSIHGRIDE